MDHALFLGGFKHGVLEQLPDTSSLWHVYEFPVQTPIKLEHWDDSSTVVEWTTVQYKHEGVWNSEYGYVHVYIESNSHFIATKLPGTMVELLTKMKPALIYVLGADLTKDEMYVMVETELAEIVMGEIHPNSPFKNWPVPPPQGLLIADIELKPEPTVTIAGINALLKNVYAEQMKAQMSFPPEWLFKAWENRSSDEVAWLNAGFRDATRDKLCYGCAEEIVGPGFGKVNDLLVPKGKGSRVRKLVCSNCGRGKFNRRGQRIGDWPKTGD